jgi:AraC-like DNA-binding protein
MHGYGVFGTFALPLDYNSGLWTVYFSRPRHSMNAIPLTRAQQFYPFTDFMAEAGIPVERYLETSRLPIKLLEAPDLYVEEPRFWHLMEKVARAEGLPDFGFQVSQRLQLEMLGDFIATLLQQTTLQRALELFCIAATRETLVARFTVERRGESSWFVMQPVTGIGHHSDLVELYDLQLMVLLVQSVAGRNWKPGEVTLQAKTLPVNLPPEVLSTGPIHFAGRQTGFEIPLSLLALPMSAHRSSGTDASRGNGVVQSEVAPDFAASLRWLIKGYLDDGMSIHELAEIVGMSRRTLQRRLHEAGTSFHSLIEQTRFELARDRLADPAASITDIAYDLGYSDVAVLSRSFKRWAGISPRQFRAAQQAGV